MNTTDLKPLPVSPHLGQFEMEVDARLKVAKAGDSEVALDLAGARLLVAREYGFQSWFKFEKHINGLARESSRISRFELAADAIISGDIETAASLLAIKPDLVRARSTRVHRATLLHYVSANGFESYRQKSTANSPGIATLLLKSGAEVDALADAYGKSTTLGLVASSAPPQHAGVQIELLEILLEYGAAIDGVPGTRSPLVAALRNGRRAAAEFLADRGARLDLEGAAGVGDLYAVESFFNPAGKLKSRATILQLQSGFSWACEYGRTPVVQFLLTKGAALDSDVYTGLTGLHWAVAGGSLEVVKLLLENGASLEAVNKYGGTALGQALWSAEYGGGGINYAPMIDALLRAGAIVEDSWQKARIAELMERQG